MLPSSITLSALYPGSLASKEVMQNTMNRSGRPAIRSTMSGRSRGSPSHFDRRGPVRVRDQHRFHRETCRCPRAGKRTWGGHRHELPSGPSMRD